MFHQSCRLLPLLFAALVVVGGSAAVRAADPSSAGAEAEQSGTQPRGGLTCAGLQPLITKGGFTDPIFVLSDADLIPNSPGSRFCLFWDQLAEAYSAWTLNTTSADQFRSVKAQMLPLVEAAGYDLCKIGFVSPYTATVVRATNLNDQHDVGRVCETEVIAHGPAAESRVGEVHAALDSSRAKANELFGWSTSWPLRVFIYDNDFAFADGTRADGRYPKGGRTGTRTTSWVLFNSDFMTVMTIDLSKIEHPDLLQWVVAHQFFKVAQGGIVGSPYFQPEFVSKGSSDYFASLTLGEDHRAFPRMFQSAVAEALAGRPSPLSMHVRAATGNEAVYLRGYVAMRYLAERWGPDAWIQLMWDNVNGNPNQYLLNWSRLTGLTVDEFDRDMNEWLRGFSHLVPTRMPAPARGTTPARSPAPARTPAPTPGPPVSI